jgi:hypothetical protein
MLQLNEISDHELQSFARRLAVRAGQEPAAVIGIGRPTARTSAERKGRQPRKLRRTSSPDEL